MVPGFGVSDVLEFIIEEIFAGTLGGILFYFADVADKTAISTGFGYMVPLLNALVVIIVVFPALARIVNAMRKI